jgi:endonuclease/exonuclease/phosphatase family metal-dependent hydrolase
MCLQEFFNTTDPKHDFNTLDTILQFKIKYNYHVEYTATVKETEHWGIATFTTYPIVAKGRITFENKSNNICIYTDVLIKKDTVRIYNMHLASVKFGQEDYTYLKKVGDKVEEDVTGMTNLVKKLRRAYLTRSDQAIAVKNHMKESPYPIILCGDFNDTPTSFTYGLLSEGLTDSFKKKGSGFGTTYNGNLPFLRIDYVMTDPGISILKHEVIHTDISDHYPLIVNVEIAD